MRVRWKKRVNIYSIVFVITTIIFNIITMKSIEYNNKLEEIELISKKLYSENARFFSCSKEVQSYEALFDILENNVILFKNLHLTHDIRATIYKGEVNEPNMLEGRFFKEEDFTKKINTAVIGKNIEYTTINGEKYINLLDKQFKVIGIMGFDFESKIDDTILVNFNCAPEIPLVTYSIDGKNINSIYKVLGNEDVFGDVSIYDFNETSIININGTKMNYLMLPYIGTLLALLYFVNFILLLVRYYQPMINTLIELGETFKEICQIILKRIYKVFLIGIMLTLIVMCICAISDYVPLFILIAIEFITVTLLCCKCIFNMMRKDYKSA